MLLNFTISVIRIAQQARHHKSGEILSAPLARGQLELKNDSCGIGAINVWPLSFSDRSPFQRIYDYYLSPAYSDSRFAAALFAAVTRERILLPQG